MTATSDIIHQMFVNLAKLRLEPEIVERMSPVVDGLIQRLKGNLDLSTEEGWNRLRIALCGMLAHGWALGMSPFNSPETNVDGETIEVRVSRDILAPIEVLKAIRYVKKDEHGRIQKVLFEPSADTKAKEQIDQILREIELKHWKGKR
ncbi:MAG: hypothetical protein EHM19_09605 [Candidatus Latescibacterota bacterium]|nr:MAG: hypothetical protein EHM19_09605 [Candidatus Latescibacterota bacterium]